MIIDYNIERAIERAIVSSLASVSSNVYTRGDSRNVHTPFIAAQAELKESLEHFYQFPPDPTFPEIESRKINVLWNLNLAIYVKTNRKEEAQDSIKYEYIQAVRSLMNPFVTGNGVSKGPWKYSALQPYLSATNHYIYDLKDTGTSHGVDDKEDFDISTLSYSMKVGINPPKPTSVT